MRSLIDAAEKALDEHFDFDRYLMISGAYRKRMVFLYRPGQSKASILVKMGESDLGRTHCRREYDALTYLAGRLPAAIHAPLSLAEFECDGRECLAQEALFTPSLNDLLLTRSLGRISKTFEFVTLGLVELYRTTSEERTEDGELSCFQHGDFWPGNLGVEGQTLVMYDLEFANPQGKPLADLLHFLIYYQVARRNVGTIGPRLFGSRSREDPRRFGVDREVLDRALLGVGPIAVLGRSLVRRYIEACGIGADAALAITREYVELRLKVGAMPSGWEERILD